MRAPVYRNAEARNTLAGLAFPFEVILVLSVIMIGMFLFHTVIPGLITYVFLRVVNNGKPDSFIQHWLNFKLRRVLSRGYLTAAARGHAPQFPHGPYLTLPPDALQLIHTGNDPKRPNTP